MQGATTSTPFTNHKIVSREDWLLSRLKLLEAEKEFMRRSDELARQRQELPWVRLDKIYTFETTQGTLTLTDLFQGRSQLMIYHFMFGPEYESGCASCSAIADGINGVYQHLANHDVMLWVVSRAPLEKLQAFAGRMGWTFPWASSLNSDFNFDFGVSFTEQQQREGLVYNYHQEPPMIVAGKDNPGIASRVTPDGPEKVAAMTGTDLATYTRERPELSSFLLEGEKVYHAYSAFSRGVDPVWAAYRWLDRAPKGRNEQGYWWRRHDEYAQQTSFGTGGKECCG